MSDFYCSPCGRYEPCAQCGPSDPHKHPDARTRELEAEVDQQIVTDILFGIDMALQENGREPMDIIDGPTVDDLRAVVEREIRPLEAEVARLREALSTAADDLDKAANQFEGIRQAQKAGHEVQVVSNSRVFAAKAQRAREALEAGER